MATAKRFSNVLGQRAQVARARRYLRRHVGDEVALGAVARAAGASMFHLARLYRAVTGETVGRALTRMRIERAADALLELPRRPISSIALEMGFRTPSSLNKAFRAALGVSPTQFRAASAAERRARLARLATDVEVAAPAYELSGPTVRTLDDLRVVYVREQGAYSEISGPLAWAALETRIAGTKLVAGQRIAASYDDPRALASDVLRYDAAVVVGPKVEPPPGTRVAIWPGGSFAVFEHRGDYRFIADAFTQIFARWRRTLALRDAPCLELYCSDPHIVPESRLLAELWVPIQPPR